MFNIEEIMAMTAITKPVSVVTQKPRVSYAQVRAALAEGYASPLNSDRKNAAVQIREVLGITCDACQGTGIFKSAQYSRPCFRCKGKGTQDEADIRRNTAYQVSVNNGTKEKSFTQYDNASWGFVA